MIPSPLHRPDAAVVALERMAWGPCQEDLEHFRSQGLTDFVEEQLSPATIDDARCEAKLAAASYLTLELSSADLWTKYYGAEKDFYKPFREVALASLLRCTLSRRQLLEVMVQFWHDHFHVTGTNTFVAPTLPHLHRTLRRHALGNFRELLVAVARTPSMLLYLDNAYSKAEDANENYARELLELHTLGVGGGYGEEDILAASQILTGWTIDADLCGFSGQGEFAIHEEIHHRGEKRLLGQTFASGRGAEEEGLELLSLLASDPNTARHLAFKLCRRLISDQPPASLVERVAQTFLCHAREPDQIAATLRVILFDESFLVTWGEKIRRPFEIAVAAMRGCGFTPPLRDDADGANLLGHLQAAGQQPFDWGPPNGFPDFKEAWNGAGTRMMSWRLINLLLFSQSDGNYFFEPLAATPTGMWQAGALVDFWSQRILGRQLPEAERAPILLQLSTQSLESSNPELAQRLRSTAALICMSPSALLR